MKRKMGRIICLSLTAALTLSSVPFTVMASPENGLVQTQSEGENISASVSVEEGKFAVYQDGITTQYDSLDEAINAAQSGAIIKLGGNAEVTTLGTVAMTGELTFDLNGHVLEYSGINSIATSGAGAVLEFIDSSFEGSLRGGDTPSGKLYLSKITGTSASINPQLGAKVYVKNINVECVGSAFFPRGDAAEVNIENCKVASSIYCVGTNAGSNDNYKVNIVLKDSVLETTASDGDSCAVMINVKGSLDIDNCQITGDRQAVIVRAGEANISNSEITVTGDYTGSKYYTNGNWGSGNEIPPGALVIGNYVNGSASTYMAAADVTVSNTEISVAETADEAFSAVYVDSNATYPGTVEITGERTVVKGTVKTGQYTATSQSDIDIKGGTYFKQDGTTPNNEINAFVAEGNKVDENGQIVVSDGAVVKIGETGYTTLATALADAKKGDKITLIGDESGNVDISTETIPEGVTISVEDGKSLTATGLGVLGSTGSIEILKGGKLLVPESVISDDTQSENTPVAFVGEGNDARLSLTNENSKVTVDFSQKLVTIDGDAEIPEGQTTYLVVGTGTKTALSADITEGSTLTVNGTLRAASGSGETGSVITVNGTIDSSNGVISLAKKAVVDIESTGNVALSKAGLVDANSHKFNLIGKFDVKAGGVLTMDGEGWIGGNDANINLTSGDIAVDMTGLAGDAGDSGKIVLSFNNAKAEIPEGKRWTLVIGSDPLRVNTDVVLDSNSSITVTGDEFRVANNSTLTNNGTINVDSLMTISSLGKVEGSGNIVNSGVVVYNGTEPGNVGNTISITGDGVVYSKADITSIFDETVENTAPAEGTEYNGETYIQAWKLKAAEYQITTSVMEGGSITSDGLTADESGNFSVEEGTSPEFTVQADEGYVITSVTVDGEEKSDVEENASEYTVAFENISESHSINAVFAEASTVTIAETENGTVALSEAEEGGTGVTQNNDGTYTVVNGTNTLLAITPDESYDVSKVEANGTELTADTDGNYTFTVTEDTTINVTFTEVEEPVAKYTITASAGEGGTISPSGEVEVAEGESVTFTITADEGYEIADVIVNGTSKGALGEYTFNDVTSNATINAVFEKITEEPEPEEPDNEPEALTIELSSDKASIFEGEKLDLKGFITNYKDFTEGFGYKSENEDVATVTDDGVVTGVKQGNTSIIISAKESDTYFATTTNAAISLTIKAKSSSGGGGGSSHSYDGKIEKEDSDNGSFSVNYSKADEGDEITITVDPDEGYVVDEVIVRDKDGNKLDVKKGSSSDKFIFEMPDGDVSVEVMFVEETTEEEEPEDETSESEAEEVPVQMDFSDVNAGDWFYNAIEYVYGNGLMSGTSETTFSPNTNTTRGMITAILYRLEGSPYVSETAAFTDVPQNEYYSNAVAWGAANGIISGYDSFTFAPDDNITREQMAAILYRYAQYKGMDTTLKGDLNIFTDKADISEYALEAMSWAVGEGLISGMGDGSLAPQGYATRAQIASILMRFAE